jgi:hypothetical protein
MQGAFRAAVPAVPYSATHKEPHHAAYSIKVAEEKSPVKDFVRTFPSFVDTFSFLFSGAARVPPRHPPT